MSRLTASKFDRKKLSLGRFQEMIRRPGGRRELERLLREAEAKQAELVEFCRAQMAEADELVQTMRLALDGEIRA